MAQISLRKYQQEALAAVLKGFNDGTHRQLIVLPTGTGKTILMAAIAKHFKKRVLVIAHREELIQQAKTKFRSLWKKADIGICKAKRNELDHNIIIGSVQSCSQNKRLEQLKKKGFDVLMIDEAHHAPAKSYLKIINGLGFMDDSQKLLIGLTATPERNDHLELGNVFSETIFSESISDMINEGHLSPVIGRRISTETSLKGVRSTNGDFVIKDLAKAINIPERNNLIARKFKEHATERKGIAFCVNVKHCHELAKAFNAVGIKAKAVWGEMPADKRKKALRELTKGKVQVLTSCGVLTEGYDEGSLGCIVMARSTKSKSFYIQCVGRGLRTFTKKENCLVLDFTDSYHNLNALISLKSTIPEAKILKEAPKQLSPKELVKAQSFKTNVIETSDKVFDILGENNRYLWTELEGNEYSLMDDNRNEIIVRPSGDGFTATLYQDGNKQKSFISTPEFLKDCLEASEYIAGEILSMNYGDLNGAWLQIAQGEPATPGQKRFLQGNKAYLPRMNKAAASAAIRKIIATNNQRRRLCDEAEPITEKQRNFLERANINTENLNKKRARNIISQLIHHTYSESLIRPG